MRRSLDGFATSRLISLVSSEASPRFFASPAARDPGEQPSRGDTSTTDRVAPVVG